MVERLKKIMAYYDLSASNFADKIEVPRSSISHLLSGRNKASLDFVMKVVDHFEEVDLNWLVYGKGVFPKNQEKTSTDLEGTLFSTNATVDKKHTSEPHQTNSSEITNKPLMTGKKNLLKIILLYEDGSFEQYTN